MLEVDRCRYTRPPFAQTVVIRDIALDRRIPHDLYATTFVKSLIMTPIGTEPPVGALGAYWAEVYTAKPEEVATVERLAQAAAVSLAKAARIWPPAEL